MIDRAHIIWCQLSFFESSSHNIENRIGQHISLVDQGKVDSIIDHVLEFTRIGFKGNLPRCWQCFFLDHFATPVYAEGLETLLLVILHSLRNGLLLLIVEASFCHGDDILQIELGSRHVDLDLESGPTGRARTCVDTKARSANTKGKYPI